MKNNNAFEMIKAVIREALRVETVPQDPRREYPKTVEECLDDNLKYRPGVYKAIKKYRDSKPWAGTQGEMQYKLRLLNDDLASVYEMPAPILVFVDKFPSGPCCFPTSKPAIIVMQPTEDGRYSVSCYLHEFAHTLGKDEKGACKWSLNLFKRMFPKSYSQLDHDGHLLKIPRKPEEEKPNEEVNTNRYEG